MGGLNLAFEGRIRVPCLLDHHLQALLSQPCSTAGRTARSDILLAGFYQRPTFFLTLIHPVGNLSRYSNS